MLHEYTLIVSGTQFVNNVVITFAAPGAGSSLDPAVLTATTDVSGAASVAATANGLASSYTVTVTTTGVITPVTFHLTNALPAPEIAVLGNGQVIADGTDFGGLALGGTVIRTFTISNSGGAPLDLTGTPAINLSGDGAGDFSVLAQPEASVGPNSVVTFQVHFTPSDVGTRVATVTIANSDSDENPYEFAIQGSVSTHLVYLPLVVRSQASGAAGPDLIVEQVSAGSGGLQMVTLK